MKETKKRKFKNFLIKTAFEVPKIVLGILLKNIGILDYEVNGILWLRE